MIAAGNRTAFCLPLPA